MGGSSVFEGKLVESPALAAFLLAGAQGNNNDFLNAGNQNQNQNQLLQAQPHPVDAVARQHNHNHPNLNQNELNELGFDEMGPVFEHCDHIRRYRVSLNRKTADSGFTLLRLFNNYTDFSSDYSRVMKTHTAFMRQMADVIVAKGGLVSDSEEDLIRHAHCEFHDKCMRKLLPRLKRIQLSCTYHLQSIQRLLINSFLGQLPPGTISSSKLDYLRLSAYPVFKDIKKYTDNDVRTIHQHTQLIFPILNDMDSRRVRNTNSAPPAHPPQRPKSDAHAQTEATQEYPDLAPHHTQDTHPHSPL